MNYICQWKRPFRWLPFPNKPISEPEPTPTRIGRLTVYQLDESGKFDSQNPTVISAATWYPSMGRLEINDTDIIQWSTGFLMFSLYDNFRVVSLRTAIQSNFTLIDMRDNQDNQIYSVNTDTLGQVKTFVFEQLPSQPVKWH